MLMNAGTSGPGREFAATHSDLIFASLQNLELAHRQIAEIKQQARESHGREVRVFGRAHIVCRPTEAEARQYFRWVHRDQADVAAIEKLFDDEYGELEQYGSRPGGALAEDRAVGCWSWCADLGRYPGADRRPRWSSWPTPAWTVWPCPG